MSPTKEKILPLWEIKGNELQLNLHDGQQQAWDSTARFPVILAGTQSGKTAFGPFWLHREAEEKGNGDYLAVTANYDLFKLKMLPALRVVFEGMFGWGYQGSDRVFSSPTMISLPGSPTMPAKKIILRSAKAEGGLESATANAAWLDEAGHPDFKIGSWEAVQRRLSLAEGRCLFSTTPYNLGYLKTEVYDRAVRGDPSFEIINFASIMNPTFPLAEFLRVRRTLQRWKFAMFYLGIFERPAGLIYDNFSTIRHTCPRFAIPDTWERFMGLDFGSVNTYAVFYAKHPKARKYYAYRVYNSPKKTAKDHTIAILKGEPMIPYTVGGSKSEDQWRLEFRAAGLPVREPATKEVEIGIDRVYGAHNLDAIMIFDDLKGYIEEKQTYSRKTDNAGEPTEEIENKGDFHRLDCERYIMGKLFAKGIHPKNKKMSFYVLGNNESPDPTPVRSAAEIDQMLEAYNGE